MGFLDKVKHFAGGHGVTAAITSVERQDVDSPSFPLTDSVMKFQVTVTAEKDVTILSHSFSVHAERLDEENPRLIEVAEDVHDESVDIIGGDLKWPYELAAGQTVEDGCCITDVDLAASLAKMDVSDPESVVDDPGYRFYVQFTADVKGSPMDPDDKVDIKLTV